MLFFACFFWDGDDNEDTPQKESAGTDHYLLHSSQTDSSPPASQTDEPNPFVSNGSPDNHHKRMSPSSSSSSPSSKRSKNSSSGETIKLFVVSSGHKDKEFKVHKTKTTMSQIYKAYAEHIRREVRDLCFKQGEKVIGSTQTPGTLELKDGDVIECHFLETSGNIKSVSTSTTSSLLPRKEYRTTKC